ncbi:LuxR family transcriptional regulator [Pseudonocardiaceae bacterium YIM PH 21723]|nr:LuxR family transcriptional regulator [Pseudonocardiaceae bacterium YIM PH 21723]
MQWPWGRMGAIQWANGSGFPIGSRRIGDLGSPSSVLHVSDRHLPCPTPPPFPTAGRGRKVPHNGNLLDRLGGQTAREQRVVVPHPRWDSPQATRPVTPPATEHAPLQLALADRRVLSMLATGLTDEAISVRLGISTRTIRRRLAAIMRRLGVRTRFQLGVYLGNHGWRPPE